MRRCLFRLTRSSTWSQGVFHQWFTKQYPVGELKGPNGHAAGQITELLAVIEDQSGKMIMVEPENVWFGC